ncbi:MAG TPA: hypothetical protein VI893_02525, partial [Thermoplasmata archaeon]|nr:hypothetical protein [Thermoplasmata archaeon]
SVAELEKVPPKGFPWGKAISWGLVFGVAVLIGWGVYRGVAAGEWQQTLADLGNALLWWFILHAVFTAIAVLIARGHPLSAAVGGLIAWFTALHPVLAAGWFAGYTEIKVRKLKNKHLVDVFRLDSWNAYFKNPVIRVLLVTVAGNLGSSIATYISLPVFVRFGLGG